MKGKNYLTPQIQFVETCKEDVLLVSGLGNPTWLGDGDWGDKDDF